MSAVIVVSYGTNPMERIGFGGCFLCFVRDFKMLFIVNVCFIKSLNLGGNGGKIRLFIIRKYRIYHGRRYQENS